MANQEQVDILNQGVMHWNKWRETNPQTKYDISMTNLNETSPATHVSISKRTEIDLSGHYFNYIDLNGINLSGANLSMANFEVVNLSNANLICKRYYQRKPSAIRKSEPLSHKIRYA